MNRGNFIISLDFELHWGAVEKWYLPQMYNYFTNTRKSIPDVLELFHKYNIHATWATVGFLFAKNKSQLLEMLPSNIPTYNNEKLNYYNYLLSNEVGENEKEDPFHFAGSLIKQILRTPNQELASHTFTHYYCNEPGQTLKQFEDDIKKAQEISKLNYETTLKSLVLPRNQFNANYASVAFDNGIKTIRSNPGIYFWKGDGLYRLARALDSLMPISKPLTYFVNDTSNNEPLRLPSSRFLRPYSKRVAFIQNIQLNRIFKEMEEAAINGKCYHLWWHPHNFGFFPRENIIQLQRILEYFNYLKEKYDFVSKSMIDFVE